MATSESYVQLIEADGFSQTHQIEKSPKKRSVIKLLFVLFLVTMIVIVVILLLTNNGSRDVHVRWDVEITNDDFQSYSNNIKRQIFKTWKLDNNRSYEESSDEHEFRYTLWHETWRIIANINSKNLSYKLCMNQFGDLTDDEFKNYHLGGKSVNNATSTDSLQSRTAPKRRNLLYTEAVDWQVAGYVSPVKNQGNCNSCWAFATTGCIECNLAIRTGQYLILSEQELVDCDKSNAGCDGGNIPNALKYIVENNGLSTEASYPYYGLPDAQYNYDYCMSYDYDHYDAITGYTSIGQNENALQEAVAKGCVAVSLNANDELERYYSSGVFMTNNCGVDANHAVLVVGYGYDKNQNLNYWKAKNSWGSSWGESGYIRICKDCGKNGQYGECGIAQDPWIAF